MKKLIAILILLGVIYPGLANAEGRGNIWSSKAQRALEQLINAQGSISLQFRWGLADPNADRIYFWDDSAGANAFLAPGNSIAITGTTLDTIQDIRTTSSPDFANLDLTTGGGLRTATSAGNTLLFQAYDVDGAAYTTFATLTANNTPTLDLATGVTIGSAYIYRVGGTDVAIADGGTGTSTGSITGTGVLTFAAGGTSQNVALTASETAGHVLLTSAANGNIGLNQTTFGTTLAKGIAIGAGTDATTNPADVVQAVVKDYAAGDARIYIASEAASSSRVVLGNGIRIGTNNGDGLVFDSLGTATKGIDLSGSGLSGSADYLIYMDANNWWRQDDYIQLGDGVVTLQFEAQSGGNVSRIQSNGSLSLITPSVLTLRASAGVANMEGAAGIGFRVDEKNPIAYTSLSQALLVGNYAQVGGITSATSNATATITKTSHGLSLAAGDLVHITGATTAADKGFYRLVSSTVNTLVVDRALAGSDADVALTVYKDVIGIFATDGTNGQRIMNYSHQNKPLQLGGDTLLATSGLTSKDVYVGGVLGLSTALSLANGGIGAVLTASNGGVFYSTATAGAILAGTATAGQILRSGASAAPAWSTPTFPNAATAGTVIRGDGTNLVLSTLTIPDTAAISTILYASAANVISALATANSGILVTSGAGVPSIATDIPTAVTIGGQYVYRVGGTDVAIADGGTGVGSWTNGQLLIGNTTGNTAVLATLTGTANQVTVTNGASSITLATPQDIGTGSSPTFAGLTITSNIAATATTLGFYGVSAVIRPTAVTQTYATADKTHAAFTSADLATTAATQTTPWGFASQAQAENIATQFNLLRADLADTKQLLNSIIDDLQALGLEQ